MTIAAYTVEIDRPVAPLNIGERGMGVRRVQEWLGLHAIAGVAIDGEYGPATARAVSSFQRGHGLEQTGSVDKATWEALVRPLVMEPLSKDWGDKTQSFGEAAVDIASTWLGEEHPREIGGDNKGPWVRHFCRGPEVAWCQGFASTVWAEAARHVGVEPPLELVLDGIWCLFVPRMVQEAKAKGLFASGTTNGVRPTPGSMFFLRGGPYGYLHVGIVEAAHDDGTMTTIEGNTNDDGSANGYEVARRVRRISGCDFAILPAAPAGAILPA